MMVRLVFLISAVLLLASCGSRANDPLIRQVQARLEGARQPKVAPVPLDVQRSSVAQAIRDSGTRDPILLVTLPVRGAVATLGIGGQNAGVVTWMDAGGVSVALRGGVVVSTRGLGHDIMSSDVTGSIAALAMAQSDHGRIQRYVNGEGQLVSDVLVCRSQRIDQLVTETCQTDSGPVSNTYELKGGRVIRSRQWLGPDLGFADIERLQ